MISGSSETVRDAPSIELVNVGNRSDVYSYGVILWEIVTEKIPWDSLNTMQVSLCSFCEIALLGRAHNIPKLVRYLGSYNKILNHTSQCTTSLSLDLQLFPFPFRIAYKSNALGG